MRENSQLTSFKTLRLSCVAPSREGKMGKCVRFKCLSSTLAIRKGTHTASCYFRYLIFLTTELQLAVFKLPAAVPEKLNRYKAFMSPILTTCSSPVTVRFNANGKSCKKKIIVYHLCD